MTRESYLERDPTIILMMDVSSPTGTGRYGSPISETLLNETANLLAAIRPASPTGLILYDSREVVANIETGQGANNRERILRTLLERAKPTSPSTPLKEPTIRPYAHLARETKALMRESAIVASTKAYAERFSSYASSILPFYERAESKYFARLRGKGAFKAFEIICSLPESVLVIVISRDEKDLDGIVEGAKIASTLNHQIIVTVLPSPDPRKRIEILSDLEHHGVGILRCKPEELSRGINAEILRLSHTRTITTPGP